MYDKVGQVETMIQQYGYSDVKASLWHKYKTLPTGWESIPSKSSGTSNGGDGSGGSTGDWAMGFASVLTDVTKDLTDATKDLTKTIKDAVVGEEIDTVCVHVECSILLLLCEARERMTEHDCTGACVMCATGTGC